MMKHFTPHIDNFLKTLEESLPKLDVREGPNSQFPDLGFEVHFGERQFDYVNSTCSLHFRLSLVAVYYTVFFQESVRVFYDRKVNHLKPGSLATFVSTHNEFVDPDQTTVNIVKAAVEQFFAKHKFVSHRILFGRRFSDAIPYRAFDDKDYPFYDFFFGYPLSMPVIIRPKFESSGDDTGVTSVVLTPPPLK